MSDTKLKQVFLFLPLSVFDREKVLNNGKTFPMISFGITKMEDFETIYNAVDVALEAGYRSFDCVPMFEQEENLGLALEVLLPKYNLKRKDVFIIDKLLPKDYGVDSTIEAFHRSCQKLKTDYLDAYLMQWPGGDNLDPERKENTHLRKETWKELIKLSLMGVIRNIGVANFCVRHLEQLQEWGLLPPTVNQVEFHPRFPQVELLEYCKENGILMQAISFKDTFHPLLLNDAIVKQVSKVVKRNPTLVLLKWTINKGVAVTPQSEDPQKIRQNFQLFDFALEKPDMDALTGISERTKYLRNPIPLQCGSRSTESINSDTEEDKRWCKG